MATRTNKESSTTASKLEDPKANTTLPFLTISTAHRVSPHQSVPLIRQVLLYTECPPPYKTGFTVHKILTAHWSHLGYIDANNVCFDD